ncbi:non-heme iron oxygenase ferredoxin subunit [Stutzerimonas stutzeri]|uniref:Ferredoxin n=1 Tax=Stutzerimonas stutzeri TaxID=316 RepID=O82822_STUST|nr:non-heme iron oxygenase ferredoxin subunit [Stutzerimonas stutzeri]BAA31271.1 ferredoxin [Stutzerimonas stutzeri]
MNQIWLKVCAASDMQPGTIRRVNRVGAAPLAVYRVGDQFYATEDTCTHGIASLSEGTLDGDVIECPFHGGAFNVCTGMPASSPCTVPLGVFEVEVKEGEVYVAVEKK